MHRNVLQKLIVISENDTKLVKVEKLGDFGESEKKFFDSFKLHANEFNNLHK